MNIIVLVMMQISLEASRKGKLGQLLALPETGDQSAPDAAPSTRTTEIGSMFSVDQHIHQQNVVLANHAGIITEDEPDQVASGKDSQEDLQKLKFRFKAWKKDFKTRLSDAKTTMKKLGNSETRKSQKKWWGKMKKEETQSRNIVLCS